MIQKIKIVPFICAIILISSSLAYADSSLSHNVGNIEMLISDWGAFTRMEGSEILPTFQYFGRDYLDPFSEVWVSSSTGHVASAYDGTDDGVAVGEWMATTPLGHVEYISDHPNASQVIHTQYAADRYDDFPFDITVDQYTYAWDSTIYEGSGDYIIMELVLANHSASSQEFYLAVQTNWDIDYNDEIDDLVDWDDQRRAGIAYDSDGTDPIYVGLALMSGKLASHNIVDAYEWNFLDSDRFDLMTNGEIDDLNTINSIPGNYFNVISTGPHTVPARKSVSVIYVFAAGQGYDELAKNLDSAEDQAAIPGQLIAEPGAKAISLEWLRSISHDTQYYRIYRSDMSNGGYSEIGQVSPENTTYRDTQVEVGVTYYYVVSTISPNGDESDYSNEVNASPGVAPPPPRDLAIGNSIPPILNWNSSIGGEISEYVIYRNFTGSEPWTAIARLDASALSFIDQNVYNGNTYYYAVASTSGGGWISEYSNVISVTIPGSSSSAQNLDALVVAPNPCKISQDSRLKFIHLANGAKIDIYTSAGTLVKTLHHTDETGEVEWNLHNDSGNMVASGIYVYYVEAYKAEKAEKHIASGKFALVK